MIQQLQHKLERGDVLRASCKIAVYTMYCFTESRGEVFGLYIHIITKLDLRHCITSSGYCQNKLSHDMRNIKRDV